MKYHARLLFCCLLALLCACKSQQQPLLLTKKKPVTTIFEAVKQNDMEAVEALLRQSPERANIKDADHFNFTPLMYAAQDNNYAIAKLLIDYDAKIGALSKGRYPNIDAFYLALENDAVAILLLFLEKRRFNLDRKYSDCEGAIYAVARNNAVNCARVLIERGVNLNVTDRCDPDLNGISPLGWAALRNNAKVAEIFIRYGASLDARDADDYTPLMDACTSSNPTLEVFKVLMDGGSDINASSISGITPLMLASARGKDIIVQHLITNNADLNRQTHDNGWSALHYAVDGGETAIVAKLMAAGIDSTLKDHEGRTAFELEGDSTLRKYYERLIRER